MSGITLLQSTSNGTSSTVPSFALAFNKPCTPGSTIIACSAGSFTTGDHFTDPTNGSFANAVHFNGSTGQIIAYIANHANTALPVTFNSGGTSSGFFLAISEWAGLAASPLDQAPTSGQGSNQTSGASGTTSPIAGVPELAIATLFTGFTHGTLSPGAGYTLDQHFGDKLATEYQILNAPGQYSAGFSWTTPNNWLLSMATFKAASPGSGPTLPLPRRRRDRNWDVVYPRYR